MCVPSHADRERLREHVLEQRTRLKNASRADWFFHHVAAPESERRDMRLGWGRAGNKIQGVLGRNQLYETQHYVQ